MAADSSAIDPIDPVGPLADEFLERHRRGEQPSVADYAERYPQHAERIKQLFPMLLTMEAAGGASLGATVANGPAAAPFAGPHVDRVGGYRLLREIGRGGMGIVYEAEQVALGRHVALKVLPLHAARDGSGLERFRQEAKAAARLHHTNIVPVYEVGQEDDACFYAMQFIAGQPLDQVLDELRRLRAAGDHVAARPSGDGSVAHSLLAGLSAPPPAAGTTPSTASLTLPGHTEPSSVSTDRGAYYCGVARVGVQVAQALDYAHKEGVIHRDVKPSNLLLDADGRVWVTDFGLAKTDGTALTQTGDIVGTVRYMAPERFNGWSDPRSDVYSLGLTLYEMLALRPAFEGSEQMQVMQQVLHDDPPPLRRTDPRLPRDLETVVAKAIDKEPSRRYQTAAELGADLQRFLDDRPILARRIALPERAWRWAKRNPALAAAAALTAAALFAVTVVSVWFAVAQARSAEEQKRLGDELRGANEKLDVALKETRRHAARSAVDRARTFTDRGHVHEAMLWLARALELAPEEDGDVAHYARASLAALEADAPALRALWRPQHPGPVAVAAFSADGTAVLTGSEASDEAGGEARLWDAATGRPLTGPLPHRGSVTQVAISPDGKALLTASSPQAGQWEVRLWDAASGAPLTDPIPHPGPVAVAACGPGGKTFLTLGSPRPEDPPRALLWRVTGAAAAAQALDHPPVPVTALAFSADGKNFLTACQDLAARTLVQLWEPGGKGAVRAKLIDRTGARVTAAAFAAGGVVYLGTDAGEVLAWDLGRSSDLRQLVSAGAERIAGALGGDMAKLPPGPHEARGAVRELALSPAGDLALVTSENLQTGRLEARLWDRSRGQWLGLTLPRDGAAARSAFSPDGRRLLTWDQGQPVRAWDLDTDRRWFAALPAPGGAAGGATAVQYTSDGRSVLAVASAFQQRTLQLWDAGSATAQGEPVHAPVPLFAAAASPDGRTTLFVGAREARAYDNLTGRPSGPPIPYDVPPGRAAFAPDAKTAALASARRLWLVDVTTGRAVGPTFPAPGAVADLRFSPDGKALWLTTPAAVRCLDVASGKEVSPALPVRGRGFHAAVPAPGGRLLGVLDQTGGALWDTTTGNRLDFTIPHWTARSGIAFSPDGRELLAADAAGYGAQVWDIALGKPVGMPLHCPSSFMSGAFCPDGRAMAVAAGAGLIRLVRLPEPVAGDPGQATRRVQALTGLELTDSGDVRPLDPEAWQERAGAAGDQGPPALAWHLRRALDRAEVEHWDAALWHVERHLRERPDDWLALAVRARALAHLNRFDEAAADFTRSFEKGPAATVFAWHLLAAHQAGPAFDADSDPRRPRRSSVATWFFDRLIERNDRQSAALLAERARARVRAARMAQALEDYERALKLAPDDAALRTERDRVKELRKEPPKSQ